MAHEGHGNHWQCVFEDPEQALRLLPVMVEQGCFIDKPAKGTLAEGVTAGIAWPDSPLCGLSLISGVRENGEARQVLMSAFPYAAEGVRRRLVVEEIIPWQSGIEAWIKAISPSGDGPSLTFFDTRFYANRRLVKVGLEANFIVAGLAYFAEVVRPEPIIITKPETIRAM